MGSTTSRGSRRSADLATHLPQDFTTIPRAGLQEDGSSGKQKLPQTTTTTTTTTTNITAATGADDREFLCIVGFSSSFFIFFLRFLFFLIFHVFFFLFSSFLERFENTVFLWIPQIETAD